MWDTLFSLTNLLALAGWIVLAFLPHKPLPLTAVLYLGVGLLCLCYAVLAGLLLGGAVDSAPVPGAAGFELAGMSIANIRALFMTDGGIVVGWTHYLAFDLFVGLWIARDADAKGFSRLVQFPFLLLTFLAGPIGLLLWLFARERRARIGARAR